MIKKIHYIIPFVFTFIIDCFLGNQYLTNLLSKTMRLYSHTLSFFTAQTQHMNTTFNNIKKQVLNTSFVRYIGDKYNEYTEEIATNKPIIILPFTRTAFLLHISLTARSLIDLVGSIAIRAPSFLS